MSDVEEFDSSDDEEKGLPAVSQPVVATDNDVNPEMDDFEYQLKLEEIERKRQEQQQADAANASTTYVDPTDGTVYEWDFEKNAWFPKVTNHS